LLSFCSSFGSRFGIIILLRSVCDDVTLVKSILLLFNRNSIPPVALLPVGDVINFVCSSLVFVSLDFFMTRGVIIVSVRIVGDGEKTGEKCGDCSSFDNDESRRSFVRLIGVEKLVLIVNG
jgi:hypothetical protein